MSLRSLLAIATVLSTACLAAAAPAPELSVVDPKCPKGYYAGFESSVFQVNVPEDVLYGKIGSFFKSEWYTGPLNFTKGKDNTVGAVRGGNFEGTDFTEELVDHNRDPGKFSMRFVLTDGPVFFGTAETLTYTEEFSTRSICAGTATHAIFTIISCINKPNQFYDILDRARYTALRGVLKGLGAYVFAGTCPTPGLG